MKKIFLITCAVLFSAAVSGADRLVTYPIPAGAAVNDNDFTVRVRQSGGQWQQVGTYLVKVCEVINLRQTPSDATMCYFDFSGEVEVQVTSKKGAVNTARVRPLSYGITPVVNGNTLTFKLNSPRNLSVEVNGDIFHNLHLFANPVEEHTPSAKDKNVIYLAPGVHRPEGGKISVPSGKTLYLAGGAVVEGDIEVRDAENVKIIGRGILSRMGSVGGVVRIANSKNIEVSGVITTQCSTGGSDGVKINNVKSISHYQWGDGMNVFASNNVLFDGVFCRNSDDCTTVYGTRLGYEGACNNITMQNSTLWADVAHPIFIGIHGDTKNPEILQNLKYLNIDILDHNEAQIDYQGCLAINGGDNNLIRDVLFENIRIEDFRKGQIVNLRIFFNEKYCTAPGLGIENVTFRNVNYAGKNANLSVIAGYDTQRKIKNVRFENLTINGVVISDTMPGKPGYYKTSDMINFFVGEHVEGVVFNVK